MSFNPTKVSNDFSSAPQITVEGVAEIAAQGFKTILNCRPDGEGGIDQPTSAQLKAAAEQHGLHYYHFPVAMGSAVTQQAQDAASVLAVAPKPMLGFCKSGMRASNVYRAAMNAPGKKSPIQWLKSKCLITRLWRWCRNKQCCK